MNKNKNLGFTLAEVLIVIGIIGVVAALTLPNLNHSTGDKEIVTRVLKAHSVLSEALDRAQAIYGPVDTWSSSSQCETQDDYAVCFVNRLTEFLKITKKCTAEEGNISSCTNSLWGYDNGDLSTAIVLPDGITVLFPDGQGEYNYPDCARSSKLHGDICFDNIGVDVNGEAKGQNRSGRDQFYFNVSRSAGIIPCDGETISGANENDGTEASVISSCIRGKGDSCTYWILQFGNLDYLKADSTGKCNDSNIVLDGTTNTSCH